MAQNGLDITSPEREGAFELAIDGLAPCILFAGYLTKRTSNMSRWRRRWWELLDDGTMLYFANEKRLKLLGEIDVARSCYDVRLGAERCLVGFPRLVPSERCFAFAVVKRTYYVYAPTAAEAKRWTELIANSSASLSRRKQSPNPISPPLTVRPRQARTMRPYSASAEGSYLRVNIDQQEQRDRATELPSSQGVQFHHQDRHNSVPTSLDWLGNSPARRTMGNLRPTWKTDSPLTKGNDTSISQSPLAQTQKTYLLQEAHGKPRSKSHSRQNSYTGELESELEEEAGTALLSSSKRMSIASSLPCSQLSQEFLRLQEKEVEIRKRLALMEELPPRPNSVDTRWANLTSNKRGRSISTGVINHPIPQRHNLADSHHRAHSPAETQARAASRSNERLGRESQLASATQVFFTDGSSQENLQEDLEMKKGKSRSLPRGTPTPTSNHSHPAVDSQEQQTKSEDTPGDHVEQNENGESHV